MLKTIEWIREIISKENGFLRFATQFYNSILLNAVLYTVADSVRKIEWEYYLLLEGKLTHVMKYSINLNSYSMCSFNHMTLVAAHVIITIQVQMDSTWFCWRFCCALYINKWANILSELLRILCLSETVKKDGKYRLWLPEIPSKTRREPITLPTLQHFLGFSITPQNYFTLREDIWIFATWL